LELQPECIYPPAVRTAESPYKNESIADIVRVVNLHASCFAVRAYGPSSLVPRGGGDDMLKQIAATATVPVLNLESDSAHPIQALADLATITSLGTATSKHVVVAWAYSPAPKPIAVPSSFVMAAAASGARLTIVSPPEFRLPARVTRDAREWALAAGGSLTETTDLDGISDADVLYMKSWLTNEAQDRGHGEIAGRYAQWRATDRLLDELAPDAFYMHCLPADRGYEVDDTVIDGKRSLVWTQVRMRREVTHILLRRALAETTHDD
jgi:N-acetylornithine carbamoyltransferase